jgi:hypothetical protein
MFSDKGVLCGREQVLVLDGKYLYLEPSSDQEKIADFVIHVTRAISVDNVYNKGEKKQSIDEIK